MIIERLLYAEKDGNKYCVKYEPDGDIVAKFKTLELSSLFVRFLRGCKLSERDECFLRIAIRANDKTPKERPIEP